MTFDQTSLVIVNGDRGMMEARRACIHGVEEAENEVRLIEVEALVPLVQRRMLYSTSTKVTWKPDDSTFHSMDMEERCCVHIHEMYDHHQDGNEGYHLEPPEHIKFLAITLEDQEVSNRGLIDINLLNEGLEAT
ncbi:unnamed protein product [Spirodela intermedia]|uniref:Uncharacterized protein n=1 Tax=Spirodela intermedia TaxID=51605 RepID=A0A7I8LEI6_SPIIN|nr:unnamed protein product [Spirodela intermedia]